MLFVLVFLVTAAIAWSVSKHSDGFQDSTPEGASPGLTIPVISPRGQTLTRGEVRPFTEPTTALLAPPPGQTASINSLPPEDPALQKVNPRRLYSVYQSLIGFFTNEAKALQSSGDSTVQLPMSTAKGDVGRLRDELGAIDRNPGLQSSLTEDDVNDIEANLAYLQKKWRLSANSMGAASPMPPLEEQEGFSDGSGSGSGSRGSGSALFVPPPPPLPPSGSGSGSSPSSACSGSSCKATLDDLTAVSTNIVAEIVRIQASGAQDATTQNRIKLLSSILQQVNDLTSGLKNGTILPSSVTLTKGQISAFLTSIRNPNSPLSNILSDWGLPSGLSNLFPTYAAGDISGADLAKQLFGKYMSDITNLSWDIGLSYKGKAEQDIAAHYASAMKDARYFADTVGTPTASNSTTTGNSGSGFTANNIGANNYRGLFDSVISSVTGQQPTVNVAAGPTSNSTGQSPQSSTMTAPFDWKERSRQICAQIKLREMDPYDFGCMKDMNTVRQENFSWRGHAKMVCTRLATVFDPSIPELCGCPPPSWIGWRP